MSLAACGSSNSINSSTDDECARATESMVSNEHDEQHQEQQQQHQQQQQRASVSADAIDAPTRRESSCFDRRVAAFIEQRVARAVEQKRNELADAVIDRIETIVQDRFYSELEALERRWLHNPYMDMFSLTAPYLAPSVSGDSSADDKERDGALRYDKLAYSAMVRQIAYDFRRYFFQEWQRELRQNRQFMNQTQRDALRQSLDERFEQVQRQLDSELFNARVREKRLTQRVHALERAVANMMPFYNRASSPRSSADATDNDHDDNDEHDKEGRQESPQQCDTLSAPPSPPPPPPPAPAAQVFVGASLQDLIEEMASADWCVSGGGEQCTKTNVD